MLSDYSDAIYDETGVVFCYLDSYRVDLTHETNPHQDIVTIASAKGEAIWERSPNINN